MAGYLAMVFLGLAGALALGALAGAFALGSALALGAGGLAIRDLKLRGFLFDETNESTASARLL